MALRSVPNHPKFAQLKRLLGLPKGATLGWLEAVWHFTGQYAQQGNIGKFTDAEIEAWVEWDGEPGALITALVASHWLDIHPEHRLIVHDWHEHADQATKKAIGKKKLVFLTGCMDTFRNSSIPIPEIENASGQAGAGAGADAVGQGQGQGRDCAVPAPPPSPEPVPPEKPFPDADLDDEAPDGLSLVQYRQHVCRRLGIAESYRNQVAMQDGIEALMRAESQPPHIAAATLIRRARDHPPSDGKWRFWIDDGGWKQSEPTGISTEGWT